MVLASCVCIMCGSAVARALHGVGVLCMHVCACCSPVHVSVLEPEIRQARGPNLACVTMAGFGVQHLC
jgi:hypothetical protein